MKLKTRDFGEIEIADKSTITFIQPLYGFEEYTEYVVLQDDEAPDSIAWLQSTENLYLLHRK
jgi:flagellar assembly factor FliW